MIQTEYRASPIPEYRAWVYVVLQASRFISVHSSLAHAVRDAQAVQGVRALHWVACGTGPGAEVWADARGTWQIRRVLLDP